MAIKSVEISFTGSYQWRGAVDPVSPFNTPKTPGPNTTYGTFQWDDSKPFDEVIRWSKPVVLRDGLVDPWKDAVVTDVKVDTGAGLTSVTAPPLTGARVLGTSGFYQKIAGSRYSLVGMIMDLVDSSDDPYLEGWLATEKFPMTGIKWNVEGWQNEYLQKKPPAVKNAGKMDPRRKKFLLETNPTEVNGQIVSGYVSGISFVFAARGWVDEAPWKFKSGTQASSMTGTAAEIAKVAEYMTWSMHMGMRRFDLDTVTGRCKGSFIGKM